MKYFSDALMWIGIGWLTSELFIWYMSTCLGKSCILMYSTPIEKFF